MNIYNKAINNNVKAKYLFSLLILSFILFVASCTKENEADEVENNPPIANSEYLKKITIGFDEFNFTYDTLDRVTEFEYGEINSPSVGGYYFEYSGNKLMNIELVTQDVITGQLVFENHNTQLLPTTGSLYYDHGNGMELFQTYNYTYNEDRIESVRMLKTENGVLVLKYEKNYFFQNENLVKQENYYIVNDSMELFYTFEFSYDENKNPGAMFGLPKIDYLALNFDDFNLFPSISICDINNYTSRTEYDKDGIIDKDFSMLRTFEYNDKGYPYKCQTKNMSESYIFLLEYSY